MIVHKVDAEGTIIPLGCHPALSSVSSFLVTAIVSKSIKQVFHRSLGPRARNLSDIKKAVWSSFSEEGRIHSQSDVPHPYVLHLPQ